MRAILLGCLVACSLLVLAKAPLALADHCAHDGYYTREYWYGGYDQYGKWWGRGWYRTWHAYPARHDKQTYSTSYDPDKEFYKEVIRKLLVEKGIDTQPPAPTTVAQVYNLRCMACHGSAELAKSKGTDYVLNPGSLSASERTNIKARITTTDTAKRMPPGAPLPPAEQKLLRDQLGAVPAEPTPPAK